MTESDHRQPALEKALNISHFPRNNAIDHTAPYHTLRTLSYFGRNPKTFILWHVPAVGPRCEATTLGLGLGLGLL